MSHSQSNSRSSCIGSAAESASDRHGRIVKTCATALGAVLVHLTYGAYQCAPNITPYVCAYTSADTVAISKASWDDVKSYFRLKTQVDFDAATHSSTWFNNAKKKNKGKEVEVVVAADAETLKKENAPDGLQTYHGWTVMNDDGSFPTNVAAAIDQMTTSKKIRLRKVDDDNITKWSMPEVVITKQGSEKVAEFKEYSGYHVNVLDSDLVHGITGDEAVPQIGWRVKISDEFEQTPGVEFNFSDSDRDTIITIVNIVKPDDDKDNKDLWKYDLRTSNEFVPVGDVDLKDQSILDSYFKQIEDDGNKRVVVKDSAPSSIGIYKGRMVLYPDSNQFCEKLKDVQFKKDTTDIHLAGALKTFDRSAFKTTQGLENLWNEANNSNAEKITFVIKKPDAMASGPLIFYFQVFGMVTGMLGGVRVFQPLLKKVGIADKWRGLLGGLLVVLATAGAFFTVRYTQNFWVFVPLYSFFLGIGCGTGYTAPLLALRAWMPNLAGLAVGIVVCGFGFGGMVFSFIQTAFVEENIRKQPTKFTKFASNSFNFCFKS
jgi:hypothetical protein